MNGRKYLAIDLGAESGRGIVGAFDGTRLTIRELKRFPTYHETISSHQYWDVLAIFSEIKDIIRQAVQEEKDLGGIGITTWGVDYALIDRRDQLVANPFHYRDKRTDGIMPEVFAQVPREEIFRQTGIQFMQLNTLFQMYATRREFPWMLDAADRLLFMPDLLNFWLTGEKQSEYTVATTSQMYDSTATGQSRAPRGNWAYPIVERLGIPGRLLADVIAPGTRLGSLTASLREELQAPDIPVYAVCCHDTASAVVAVPVRDPRSAYLSSGTWSLLGTELADPVINEPSLRYSFTNEGGFGGSIRFLTNIMGLWIMQECRRSWEKAGKSYTYEELSQLAAEQEPFAAFIDVNDTRFLFPGDMPSRIREFCAQSGQKVPGNEGQTVRVILESLAMEYRCTVEHLEETLGEKIETIHIVGGGSQNKLLSRFAASATRKVVITGPIEATAAGNILVQALAGGALSDVLQLREVVRNSFPLIVYQPSETSLWEDQYHRYKDLKQKPAA